MTEFIGKTIGNYRIEALLGAGGMGQVFRARHILLDRPAALKLLHGNLAQDPMFQTRFRQEAQAAAKLRRPRYTARPGYGVGVNRRMSGG
jgi:serine/threonine protein kinase